MRQSYLPMNMRFRCPVNGEILWTHNLIPQNIRIRYDTIREFYVNWKAECVVNLIYIAHITQNKNTYIMWAEKK